MANALDVLKIVRLLSYSFTSYTVTKRHVMQILSEDPLDGRREILWIFAFLAVLLALVFPTSSRNMWFVQ